MKIVTYVEELHLPELSAIAHRMRNSERAYPPREDCGESLPEVEDWLRKSEALFRWVAIQEDKVVGHISLQHPEVYLRAFIESCGIIGGHFEISKFFVSPDCRKSGAGRLLFAHAVKSSSTPSALAVLDGSHAARTFYSHHGMEELGIYHGRSGVNHIFVDKQPVGLD